MREALSHNELARYNIGAKMQKQELDKDGAVEKSLWREVLSWIVFASSILWLLLIWNAYVQTPNDRQTFFITVLIYLLVWAGYMILRNRGERYQRASQIISALAMYPPILLYFGYDLINPKSELLGTFQLILFTACFGLF